MRVPIAGGSGLLGRGFTTNDTDARRDLGDVGRVSRKEGLARYS